MDSYDSSSLRDCSVVIPFYNEADVITDLYGQLTKTMTDTGLDYELVFIDDGSTDSTLELLKGLARSDDRVVIVEFRRNFGKTAAYAAGFDVSNGRIIISMDGDLQHLPKDIPRFLDKINEGYDVVCSWRKTRVDNLFARKIPSRIANWLAARISGVDIHDFGGGFKAYRREILRPLHLYGDMQRFIPALASQHGAKIAEIPIENIPRPFGKSRYGLSRIYRVFFDLITLTFLLGYATRPLHFLGKAALVSIFISACMSAYVLYDRFVYNVPIMVGHAPMAALAAVLFLTALILIAAGLIGEMMCRVYYESTGAKIYAVRKIHQKKTLATD